LLQNRLLLTDLLARNPESPRREIARPIIIAGLPRTGTTHLQNLISADPAIRSLPYWECVEPVPAPGDVTGPDGVDPRITRCDASLELMLQATPYFPRMFDIGSRNAHEEINLLAIDFSTMYFDTWAPMPSWREYYLSHDQTPHYEYMRTVLKALQFLRGGDRWVLKSPQHLEQFGPLISTFPDATVVVTHRDPASVVASMATMIAYTARLSLDPVDPVRIGHYWADLLSTMLNTCLETRPAAADRSDVRFDEFRRTWARSSASTTGQASLRRLVRSAVTTLPGRPPAQPARRLIYDLADFDSTPTDPQRPVRLHRALRRSPPSELQADVRRPYPDGERRWDTTLRERQLGGGASSGSGRPMVDSPLTEVAAVLRASAVSPMSHTSPGITQGRSRHRGAGPPRCTVGCRARQRAVDGTWPGRWDGLPAG
jgi:hypothetical protein